MVDKLRRMPEEAKAQETFSRVKDLFTGRGIDLTVSHSVYDEWEGQSGLTYKISATSGEDGNFSATFSGSYRILLE